MLTEKEHQIAEEVSMLLQEILTSLEPPPLPERYAAVESLQVFSTSLRQLREFLYAASNGDLSGQVKLKGFAGGTLKTLQANLRHMTWQTKMVASGDFSQRVEFMGEFSESFNAMVLQLDQTLKDLLAKKTELSRANDELLKEISIRRETEAALRESREELRLLAMTDLLTGLFNRRHFNQVAEEEIGRSLRYQRPLSIMSFDLDFFKRVNDTFGHLWGDRVLEMIAHTTKEVLRATEIPARFGGEEFIVLLPETTAPMAANVAERLREKIEEAVLQTEKGPIKITASFGVSDALDRNAAKPSDQLLSQFISTADHALYASKSGGRNRVTIFGTEPFAMEKLLP